MRRRHAVQASAPTRVDLAGGTLDIWPISVLVPGALTVNLAVELRAWVRVEPLRGRRLEIVSLDRGARLVRSLPLGEVARGRALSLVARCVAAYAPATGLRIVTRAQAPAGAGLGGSSALAVAVVAALARFTGTRLSREGLLRRAMNLETIELGVPTGNQDYLAAIHGGLAAYHHGPDGTRRERLPLPPEFGAQLVLAYTGQPRRSGLSNWRMFRRFVERHPLALRRMGRIASLARAMRDALLEGDLERAGTLLGAEARLRYGLAPGVATPAILQVSRAARRAGAYGAKLCGAGGGGCVVALARPGRRAAVAEAMRRAGAEVLEVRPARSGLRLSAP